MLRKVIIVSLVALAIPTFNKVKDYVSKKGDEAKIFGDTAKKIFHYSGEKK